MHYIQRSKHHFLIYVTIVIVLVLGFLASSSARWYCDDTFITLRYAEQFLHGNGFVYNEGERVEGYTNFLWLVIITFLQRLGFDPVEAAMNLGIGAFLGTLVLFALVSHRISSGLPVLGIPATSLALIANRECRIWASSGMETAFFTFLLSLAFFVFFFTHMRRGVRLSLSALFVVLAVMTRPDGLLIYGVAVILLVVYTVRARLPVARAVTDLALFAAPLIIVYIPYVLWKVSYYGSFFPNTYYAKSANIPYFSQGFYYVWLYFRGHPTSLLFLLSVSVFLPLYAGTERAHDGPDTAEVSLETVEAAVITALCAVSAYLVLFVARVGGGFMYARFIVPMLPFMYFMAEWSLRRFLERRRAAFVIILLLVPFIVAFGEDRLRNELLLVEEDGRTDVRIHRGILDEHHYYTKCYLIVNDRLNGTRLRRYFRGLDATVLLRGQACFGYYAGFKKCIDNSGLTDPRIARLPVSKRGRIGHEKAPTLEWMVEQGVDFVFSRPIYKNRDYRMVFFRLGDMELRAEMITYDAALMRHLHDRMGAAIRFTPFDRVLDHYIEHAMPERSRAERRDDYREFKEFYFMHNDDPEREEVFLDALSPADGDSGSYQ
jgi:hypothetical protein